jgi:hypothetical protein
MPEIESITDCSAANNRFDCKIKNKKANFFIGNYP